MKNKGNCKKRQTHDCNAIYESNLENTYLLHLRRIFADVLIVMTTTIISVYKNSKIDIPPVVTLECNSITFFYDPNEWSVMSC